MRYYNRDGGFKSLEEQAFRSGVRARRTLRESEGSAGLADLWGGYAQGLTPVVEEILVSMDEANYGIRSYEVDWDMWDKHKKELVEDSMSMYILTQNQSIFKSFKEVKHFGVRGILIHFDRYLRNIQSGQDRAYFETFVRGVALDLKILSRVE